MLEKFFKNEMSENISQKFHDQGKIDSNALLSIAKLRAEK